MVQGIQRHRGPGRHSGSCGAAAAVGQPGRNWDEESPPPYCKDPKVRRGERRAGRTSEGRMEAGGEERRDEGSEGVRRSQTEEELEV